MKKIYLLLMISLSVLIADGATLINTSFENSDGWSDHSSGDWTQNTNDGTWTGHGMYANTGSANTGSRKVGFNTVGDWLELPPVNNPGTITFYARLSSSGTASSNKMKIQRYDGSSWVDVGEISQGTDIYTQYSIDINYTGTNVRLRFYRSADQRSHYIDDVVLTDYASSTPTLTVSPSSLSGFSYVEGSGPSTEQSFTVEGSNLTNNITLTPPADYEISTGTGGSFVATNPITLTQSGGTVSTTTIYTRLKAGLTAGDYNNEDITATSSGATDKTVTCSGRVTSGNEPQSGDVVINEIMYNSAGADEEWIELYNTTANSILLDANWVLSNTSASWSYTFDGSKSIDVGGYLTIEVGSSGSFPFTPDLVRSTSQNQLVNSTSTLTLKYNNNTIDEVTYDDGSPWPTNADGNGPSLELIQQELNNSSASNWQASAPNGGTPGAINSSLYGTWNGSASSTWSNDDNWSTQSPYQYTDITIPSGTSNSPIIDGTTISPSTCNDLTVESGATLIIPVNKALTVNGTLTNNAGNSGLVIESTVDGTGSLIAAAGNPNAMVNRYLTAYSTASAADGWHFLSAPVSGYAFNGSFKPTSGTDDLYRFNEAATTTTVWINYYGGNFGETDFQVGEGYLVAYASPGTKTFTGPINTGSHTLNLNFTSGANAAAQGWNLLGNPYTSAIKWNSLTKSADVGGIVYVYNASTKTYDDWNGSAGDLSGGIIPAMQGFFVHTASTGQSITMETADQVHQATTYYKAAKALAENTLKITLSNSEANNNTYIQIRDDATKGFDNTIDGYKLFGFGSAPELYTQIDNTKYSINCLPTSLSNYSLPIGLKIKSDGNYNLSFAGLDTFANGIDLVLEDTKTGEMTTITGGVTIPFHFSSSDDPNRFVLHINGVTAVPNVNKTDGIQVFAYGHTVYLHGQQSLLGSVSIFNTLGQQVYTGVLNGAAKQQIRLNQQRGVYFVRLKENSHVITRKIFIQ